MTDGVPSLRLRTWDVAFLCASLAGVIALAWWYLYLLARDMSAMSEDMPSIAGMHEWSAYNALMMFVMWAVMMVGMMVPTSMRAVLVYAAVASQAKRRGSPIAVTWYFVTGYIVVWTAFSVAATALQWSLEQLGLLSPMMVSSSPLLGATLLVGAGVYQLTPWKDTCLVHCQSPANYLAGRFGPRMWDGVTLGVRHGAYCLGCCWVIMLLLFVGGVMNLVWIAAITGFVLLEKLMPARYLQQASAGLMIAMGIGFLAFT